MSWNEIEIPIAESEHFETLNGLWTGKKPPFVEAGVIRNTNFSPSGEIDYSNIAYLQVEAKQLTKLRLEAGDIIVERSGGGPKQPVGRVVYFDRKEGVFSFSNFTSAIRVKDKSKFDPRFVFYRLMELYQSGRTEDIQRRTTGIRNLDFTAYKDRARFPCIPLPEQKKIAHILSTVQRAIEAQERIIQTTTELKKALMHKLFTEGLRGEPQKQTDIGPIPESWNIKTVGDYCDILNGFAFKSEDYVSSGGIPNFRVVNINWDGTVSMEDCKFLPESFTESHKQYLLNEGDILFVMVGATRGKLAQIPASILPALMNQNMWRIVPRTDGIDRDYLFHHLRRSVINLLREDDDQARGFFKKSDFRGIRLAIPSLQEQVEIRTALGTLETKLGQHAAKAAHLKDLFRTLLHELMTAKTRVHELEIQILLSA
jgi:type I restriction enzyme S subunit